MLEFLPATRQRPQGRFYGICMRTRALLRERRLLLRWHTICKIFRVGGAEMICKVGCSILLLTSAVMAQQTLMPGTVASATAFDPGSVASPSSFDAAHSSSSDARQPITGQQRIDWVVRGTIGPEALAGELFGAGWDTLFNRPKTYGPHWEGFGDRLGMSMAGNAVSNTMEAGLGAIWGEDPRYTRDVEAPFGHRVGHVVKMTFMAQNRDGQVIPAYARFIAIPGSNFLSNAWRAPGDDTARDAAVRTGTRIPRPPWQQYVRRILAGRSAKALPSRKSFAINSRKSVRMLG